VNEWNLTNNSFIELEPDEAMAVSGGILKLLSHGLKWLGVIAVVDQIIQGGQAFRDGWNAAGEHITWR